MPRTMPTTSATASASWARNNFAEVLSRAAYGKERITIERRGRPLAVLVPVEDLELLEGTAAEARGSKAAGTTTADPLEELEFYRRRVQELEQLLAERDRQEASYRTDVSRLAQAFQPARIRAWNWTAEARLTQYLPIHRDVRDSRGRPASNVWPSEEQLLQAIHPDDRERLARAWDRAYKEHVPYEIEYRLLPSRGEVRHQYEIGRPEFDESGRYLGHFGTTQDITERKRAEEALRDSRDQLRLITDNLPVLITYMDSERRFRFANKAARTWYALPAEEILGRSVEDILGESACAKLEPRIATALSGVSITFAETIVYPDRTPRDVEISYIPDVSETGKVQGYFGLVQDITERKRAEDALRKSEQRYRELFEESPLPMLEENWRQVKVYLDELSERGISDIPGFFRDNPDELGKAYELADRFGITQAAVRLYRAKSKEELRAAMMQETADPDELKGYGEMISAFHAGASNFEYEAEEIACDGTPITTRIRAVIPPNYRDDWARALVTMEDITERKKAEDALARNESRLRQATKLAGLGHWVWDAVEDRCIYCSEENAQIHGVSVKDYMARASALEGEFSFVHAKDRDRVGGLFKALRKGIGFEAEYRLITPAGEQRYVQEIAAPVFDENGTVVREHGTIQDISERRQAEETIRTREAWLSAILENAPIEIVLKDIDGRCMAVSRNVADTLGVEMDDLIGGTTVEFFPDHIAAKNMAADRKVMETGQSLQQEIVEETNGSIRYSLSAKFPLKDESGGIIGICSLTSDITEVKQAEERLRQAQKMEAVGQLTGGVAHDFNNLLAVILGNMEYLADRLGGDDRHVRAVTHAAARGAELTERLLAFSRRQPLRPRATDLSDLVAGMSELLARTLGETIELTVRNAPDLWPVLADPGQIENALLNLALNARDAMPDGGNLSIRTTNATLDEPRPGLEARAGDYVVLTVTDTGAGMSPGILERAFEPFFTTKDVGEGSGLGLSMVYGFAQQSGGFVSIESEADRGTTVRLYLPRAEGEAPRAAPESWAAEPPRARGETVLVLEDALDVRELAVAMLEDLGYSVLAACDAEAAAKTMAESSGAESSGAERSGAERSGIDLLLTDVALPGGKSGPDFADEAKRRWPGLKVLFMSGYPAEALAHQGKLGEDIPLLSKPFRKVELAHWVREELDRE